MKKILSLIILSVFCLNAINAGVTWEVSEDSTLTITGTGDMDDSAPWYWKRKSIKYVVIKEGVTSIGDDAFDNCSCLTSITIPNSVTSIGDRAFYGCSSLTSITIPNSVTSISNAAFERCSNLTSVTIPNSVTSIGNTAFQYCSGITSIIIPNCVTSIGYNAFWGCRGLTSIIIPNSVTSIGNSAFGGCSGLTSIKVETGNEYYDSRNDCNAIIRKSDNTLVCGCMNTVIPNSVTSIGGSAFANCSGLASIIIPNNVTSIGNNAFASCSALTSITIPNSVTSIGNYAFSNCSGLTSIEVESGNAYYDSRNGCNAIIRKSDNTLISGCMNTVIPNSVMCIGADAFEGCTGLTSVIIPNGVTSICDGAFYSCDNITSIYIPSSVTSFGIKVFVCKNLDKITIDANKDLIIEGGTFDYSDLGEIIMCGETLPKSTGDYAFNSKSYETAILYVPSTLYEEYRSTSPWSKFVNIKILDDTVAGIYKSKLERPSASVIYDVNGRRVIDSTLKPGVYIWGGKKIAIK